MKAPFQLHAAAAILIFNGLCYLFVAIPAGVKSHALLSGYTGVAFILATAAMLYFYPRIARWVAAILFLLSAMSSLSAGMRRINGSPLFGIVYLLYATLTFYLFCQLGWGAAIKAHLARRQARSEKPPNQATLQTPDGAAGL